MAKEVNIRSWESNWEQIFKDAGKEGLFFSTSIGNIASYIIGNIDYLLANGKNRLGVHPSKMLSLIIKSASSTDVEARILRLAAPSAIRYLTGLASQTQPPDLKILRKNLMKVVTAYNSTALLVATKRITLQFVKDKSSNDSHLLSLIPYLAKALLSRYPEKFIKDVPREAFSRCYANIYQDAIRNSIKSSQGVSNAIEPAYRNMLSEISNTLHLIEGQPFEDYCDDLFRKLPEWRTELLFLFKRYYKLLIKLDAKVANVLDKQAKESQQAIRSELITIIKEPLRLEMPEIIKKVILYTIIKCLSDTHKGTEGIRALSRTEYPIALSTAIKAAIYGDQPSFIEFSYVSADSQIWAIARSLSRYLVNSLPSSVIETAVQKVTDLSVDLITTKTNEKNIKKISYRVSTLETVSSRFYSLTSFKQSIRELIGLIIRAVRNSLHELESSADLILQINAFHEEHLSLIQQRLSKKEALKNFPRSISGDKAKSLFEYLFAELMNPRRHWRVFFLLGDIDCNSRVIRIGKVIFYDARDWYFGEPESFDLAYDPTKAVGENFKTLYSTYETWRENERNIELRRNSARAYVDVEATDAYTAARDAEKLLNQALDNLVFAFSSRNKVAGFKPQLPLAFDVTELQTDSTLSHFSPRPQRCFR
jgi:hypothetical protein